jgi:hypothetical protein
MEQGLAVRLFNALSIVMGTGLRGRRYSSGGNRLFARVWERKAGLACRETRPALWEKHSIRSSMTIPLIREVCR